MKPIAIVILALSLTSCTGGILNPPTGPGTDYPCGARLHQCADGGCCWDSQVCGGQPGSGCPAGACCYSGDSFGTPQRQPVKR